jgi:hypothetical protein
MESKFFQKNSGKFWGLLFYLCCVLSVFLASCAIDAVPGNDILKEAPSGEPPVVSAKESPYSEPTAILTSEWAVLLLSGTDPDALASQYDAVNLGQIGSLADTYLFSRPCVRLNDNGEDALVADPRVLWMEQQVIRDRSLRESSADSNEPVIPACKQ